MDRRYGYVPQNRINTDHYLENDSPTISPIYQRAPLSQLNTQSHESLRSYSDFDDPNIGQGTSQSAPKSRRRQHGLDHVKHKRTRSGCYTCRQRRVKCDEAQPACERCRKGKRDCIYPDPIAKPAGETSKNKSAPADSASNSSGDEQSPRERLSPLGEDEDDIKPEPLSAVSAPGEGSSEMPAHDSMSPPNKDKTTTSLNDHKQRRPSVRQPSKAQPQQAIPFGPRWSTLPKDVRFYIRYHKQNITCNHYSLKYDGKDFLKTTFLEIAMGSEPLLYAVVAFSAYFHTLSQPNGRVQTFLSYYHKAVSLLRESLAKSTRHSPATLLTILQLATFEEYLGDWVNVHSHQKAAFEILTQLFTVDNIMQNETRRKIIAWYIRFDIVSSLMAGSETVLGREWHATVADYYVRQRAETPSDLGCIYEETFASTRLMATDIALCFGKMAKGAISPEEFSVALQGLRQKMEKRDKILTNAFAETRTYITEFPNTPLDRSEDIVDATDPKFLLAGDLWIWNLVMVDWWAIKLMFSAQLYQLDKSGNPMELVELSYRICQMFEGFQYAKKENQSLILSALASLGIASTALPRDEKHSLWARRKFALIERCGYVYPLSFRVRMSDHWSHNVQHWWLDNDEGYPPILRQIREFVEYRTQNPNDAISDALRSLRGVFKAMTIEQGDRLEESPQDGLLDDFPDMDDWGHVDSSPDVVDWSAVEGVHGESL